MSRTLWAVSDLHVRAPGNLDLVREHVRPANAGDWLIVAGDIAEDLPTIERTLGLLQSRFAQVIYTPGNHELYSRTSDTTHGRAKYDAVIAIAQRLGVLTPEDPFPMFAGHTVVPLFTLYDHSWRDPSMTPTAALAAARDKGIVLMDDLAIAPYEDVILWCRERLRYSVRRLASVEGPTILVNHWPLAREAMSNVRHQEIGLWSGTRHTQEWPERYRASAVIYGHLHIPVEFSLGNVTHAEVSLGYPRERKVSLPPRLEKNLWPYPVLVEEVTA